ncbi:MAG: hypothetical protein Q4D04_01690 [Clostridia bacterium]|nr:hypothetical protein [Clostridia bacterium]
MSSKTRSNALLMEILLVVFFFLLSATVLMRLFLSVHEQSRDAGRLNSAVVMAQNWLERARAGDEGGQTLIDGGFSLNDGQYRLEGEDGVCLVMELDEQPRPAGMMVNARARAMVGDEPIYEVETGWYVSRASDARESAA